MIYFRVLTVRVYYRPMTLEYDSQFHCTVTLVGSSCCFCILFPLEIPWCVILFKLVHKRQSLLHPAMAGHCLCSCSSRESRTVYFSLQGGTKRGPKRIGKPLQPESAARVFGLQRRSQSQNPVNSLREHTRALVSNGVSITIPKRVVSVMKSLSIEEEKWITANFPATFPNGDGSPLSFLALLLPLLLVLLEGGLSCTQFAMYEISRLCSLN